MKKRPPAKRLLMGGGVTERAMREIWGEGGELELGKNLVFRKERERSPFCEMTVCWERGNPRQTDGGTARVP